MQDFKTFKVQTEQKKPIYSDESDDLNDFETVERWSMCNEKTHWDVLYDVWRKKDGSLFTWSPKKSENHVPCDHVACKNMVDPNNPKSFTCL